MKADIHPKYVDAEISCVCGNVIKTRSTVKTIKVEICSNCHPFFTGRQKLVDTAGRIDRFRRKYAHLQETKTGEPAGTAATPGPAPPAAAGATAEAGANASAEAGGGASDGS